MSFLQASLRASSLFSRFGVVLALVALAACGSDKNSASAVGAADANGTAASGNSTVSSINNSSSSTKMARQSSDDVQEQADLSESASTGTSDDGGTTQPQQHGGGKGFDMQMAPSVDFNNITADFNASLSFSGGRQGGASVHGGCGASLHRVGNGNFAITLTTDLNRTLDNNDVIVVQTEPNITITRSGTRMTGTVTRGISGKVHRSLTSASDPNRNFDLTIDHQSSTVVDLYGPAPTFLLQSRTHNGTASVTDHLNGASSTVTFKDLQRGSPSKCLCPTGGTITQVVTKNGNTETHTYTFGGTCGTSTVAVDGNVAVSTSTTATAKLGNTAPSDANSTVSSTTSVGADVHGSLTWEQCVPSGT